MKYDHPDLPELLAAEYVLGTLRGAARRRYLALVQARPQWRLALTLWESRLHGLAETVVPVTPPSRVWQGIETRLGWRGRPQAGASSVWWRRLALLSTTLALGLGVLQISRDAVPPAQVQLAASAVLTDGSSRSGWLVTLARLSDGHAELRVAAQAGLQLAARQDYELWALPPGGKPVSLGLLPQSGEGRLTLDGARAALVTGGALAVSVEPPGGSPTGQPTGEVRYQGKLTML